MFTRLLIVCAFALACAPQTPMPPAATAPEQAGPTVVLPDGLLIRVELAADDETRAQGLMYRESVAPERGMLFLFPETAPHAFWMKNTLVPLDMIWLDEGRRIVHITRDAAPCRADPCPSYPSEAPSRFVLELAAGQAAAHKLRVGDLLTFRDIDVSAAR